MADHAKLSLYSLYPHHLYVPALLGSSATLNVLALCVPFMQMERMFFFEDQYSLPHSVALMWGQGYYLLAGVILAFSIIFPFGKLAALMTLWFVRFDHVGRRRLLEVLGFMGKWSMLDVFIVALLLVISQSQLFLDAQPKIGLYLFVFAILLSMISSLIIERLAKVA